MGMYGADIAQLRALAASFDQHADVLERCRQQVGGAIRIGAWQGPDASRFRQHWDSQLAAQLMATAHSLRDNAAKARTNADQQETASQVDSSGGSGTGSPPSSPPAADDPKLTDDLGEYEPADDIGLGDDDLLPTEIEQGSLGDCWFLAGLGAVVHDNPDFIREHMRQNPDGTWTITMYRDGEPVEITVEPTVPSNGEGARSGEPNWASLYEKAAAVYWGGDYDNLDGGWSSDAFEAITGATADHSGELNLADIRDRLADGPVAVGTEKAPTWWPFDDQIDDNRIVPNHAYIVDDVREIDGELKIHVLNPWGPDGGNYDGEHRVGDIWLTEKEYKENFDSVYSVPGKGR